MSEQPDDQETGHEASVNQSKHEPTPASHDADSGQLATAHPATGPDGPTVPGDAVRDMMGGPSPQGDTPDAPGTQIAAADEGEQGPKARYVANAVPGKPDGEVDTRS
ncbi:MAG TPA: hypothetical protein VHY58_21270 [Streptosporangiaceae bacterium]|jgi:hypothetical protein|nr:hypothetical protein [Streptosporangiaceae bacterium]